MSCILFKNSLVGDGKEINKCVRIGTKRLLTTIILPMGVNFRFFQYEMLFLIHCYLAS